MRHLLAGAVCVMTLVCGQPALADCTRSGFKYGPNFSTFLTFWTVQKGTTCIGALQPSDTAIVGIGIARDARHGQAGVAGKSSFAYNPPPDFVGRDDFALYVDWVGDRGARGRTIIEVQSTMR